MSWHRRTREGDKLELIVVSGRDPCSGEAFSIPLQAPATSATGTVSERERNRSALLFILSLLLINVDTDCISLLTDGDEGIGGYCGDRGGGGTLIRTSPLHL